MRALTTLVILASIIWSGYWVIGSAALEKGVVSFLDQVGSRKNSVALEYSGVSVQGFPNRFDTTVTDINISDPVSRTGWNTPFVRVYALSYKPNHIIATLPRSQVLTLKGERIQIDSDEIKGSVIFKAESALGLDRTSFVLDNLRLRAGSGWRTKLASANLATRQTALEPLSHDLAIQIRGITPTRIALDMIDPTRQLPETIDAVTLDVTLGFSAPWNRFSFEKRLPKLTGLTLKKLVFTWGDVQMRASGTLTIDRKGFANGTITLTAKNWPVMFQVARSAGLITPDYEAAVESGLKTLAKTSDGADTIVVPLRFANGQMSLASIPLGPAPRLN